MEFLRAILKLKRDFKNHLIRILKLKKDFVFRILKLKKDFVREMSCTKQNLNSRSKSPETHPPLNKNYLLSMVLKRKRKTGLDTLVNI